MPTRAELANAIRALSMDAIDKAKSGHPGAPLGMADMAESLWRGFMKHNPADPSWANRDRFVLSKGHAAPGLYGTLCERGFFGPEEFDKFRQLHGILQGHPDVKKCPGVDASTGSLGQGISIAAGMALGAKKTGNPCHVYTIIGDGESQEGLVWEASMAAAHYGLDNLTVIFDHNKMQIDGTNDEVMSLGDIGAKWRAFGYDVIEVAESSRSSECFKRLLGENAPVFLQPAWMEREKNALKGTVTRMPTREDIDVPVEEHLIVELYSK